MKQHHHYSTKELILSIFYLNLSVPANIINKECRLGKHWEIDNILVLFSIELLILEFQLH